MAGYIGSKSSVTLVDGYTEAEADAEFVTKTGDSMTGGLTITTADNTNQLTLISTDADANAAPTLELYRNSGSPADEDLVGQTRFVGRNDNSQDVNYAIIKTKMLDVSDGTEDGRFEIETISAGGGLNRLTIDPTELIINEGSADLDFRVESDNLTHALFVQGSDGNVGIGTSNPIALLSVVDSSTGSGMELQPEAASNTNRLTNYNRTASAYKNFRLDALQLEFQTSGNERMRINGSGEILIGKTSAASSTVGAQIIAGGISQFGRSGAEALRLTRTTNDGDILQFQKNDTLVGFIGTLSESLYIGTPYSNDSALRFSAGTIHPCNSDGSPRDNGINLGYSSGRFTSIFAVNGTIQTSDQTEKQDIASLTATEMLVAKRLSALFKTFRWKDSVAEKGDNARTHTGVIAQEVQAAFTAEGLDASKYGLFCSDTWWEHGVNVPAVEADEDNEIEAKDAYTRIDHYHVEAEAPEGSTSKTRLGIRYPELLSFVAAYNEQRFASIEARLTALEA